MNVRPQLPERVHESLIIIYYILFYDVPQIQEVSLQPRHIPLTKVSILEETKKLKAEINAENEKCRIVGLLNS